MPTSVSVILAVTEPLLLAGCRSVLGAERDIELQAECSTIVATLRAVRRHRSQVLIVDGALSDDDWFDACARLAQASPHTCIVWLARRGVTLPNQQLLPRLSAVLPPQVRGEELVACVRALALGHPWRIPTRRGEGIPPAAEFPTDAQPSRSPLSLLTVRERQIAQGIASGKRNREIAQTLGITAGTVKLHLHRTYAKLGVTSRLALFKKLVQEAQPKRAG